MRTQDTHETTHVVSNPESLFEAAKFQWMITDLAISRGLYHAPAFFADANELVGAVAPTRKKARPDHPSQGDPT